MITTKKKNIPTHMKSAQIWLECDAGVISLVCLLDYRLFSRLHVLHPLLKHFISFFTQIFPDLSEFEPSFAIHSFDFESGRENVAQLGAETIATAWKGRIYIAENFVNENCTTEFIHTTFLQVLARKNYPS